MASVEMSLDDIIAQNRKKKQGNGGNRGGNRRPESGGRRTGGGGGRPRGYVDHDAPRSGPVISGGNPNKMVRVNLSNLAPTVTSSDLEELFGSYNVETATVHYNERGESCCTGDIYLRKRDADKVVKDFRGVALDGQVMRLLLVDGSQNMSSRVGFTSPRRSGGGVERRSGGDRAFRNDKPGFRRNDRGRGGRGGRDGGRTARPQKTDAELDAELDAYMSKPKST